MSQRPPLACNEALPQLLLLGLSSALFDGVGLGVLHVDGGLSGAGLVVGVLVFSHLLLVEQFIGEHHPALVSLVHIEGGSGGILGHAFQVVHVTVGALVVVLVLVDEVVGLMLLLEMLAVLLIIVNFILAGLESLHPLVVLLLLGYLLEVSPALLHGFILLLLVHELVLGGSFAFHEVELSFDGETLLHVVDHHLLGGVHLVG
jgi:hypothetical protein